MRPVVRTQASALLVSALLVAAIGTGFPVTAQSPGPSPSPASSVIPAPSDALTATPAPSGVPVATGTPSVSVHAGDPRLVAAVDATVAAETLRTAFSVLFTGSTLIPEGTSISGEGQTNLGLERRMRLSLDMTAFGVGAFDLIMDGTDMYVRGLPIGDVPPDQWIHADLTADDAMTASLAAFGSGNNDASLLLYFLLGATGPAEILGEETIDGVPTTWLGATLDLDRALELVPEEIRPTLEENIAEVREGGVAPVLDAQVWVDAQDLVHRLRLDYSLGDAMGGGGMVVTFDFRQHGEPLDLGIPAPEETVDITTLG